MKLHPMGSVLIQKMKIDSLRADITLFEAARAYCAADGRTKVMVTDIHAVLPMALRLRRSKFIDDYLANQEIEEQEINQVISQELKSNESSGERILACINGSPVDRPPLVLWRHFPVADQDPVNYAKATLDFQNRFDFDLIKVSPSSSYCLVDWNVKDEWRGNPEGTRDYIHYPISNP